MKRAPAIVPVTSLSISLGLILVTGPCPAPAQDPVGDERRGEVVEVKGEYCKVTLVGNLTKAGQSGRVFRDGKPTKGRGVVTAVETDYIVVRVTAFQPQVGDQIVLGQAKPENKSDPPAASRPVRKTRKQLLAEKTAAELAEHRARWMALLERTGVKPWPAATDDEHHAAIERHRQFIQPMATVYPGMRLYETENFLFYSNIPSAQVAPYVQQLDRMHDMLMSMYQIPAEERVFLGKALVLAFITKDQFQHFERTYMKSTPADNVYGYCHQKSNGDVIVGCYRGSNPDNFGQMLVHETSHGFLHRYRTAQRLPKWVNEGLAEYVGLRVVPASRAVQTKQRRELQALSQTRSLGGAFNEDANRPFAAYGMASLAVTFMIQQDDRKFAQFINGLKGGLSYPESLMASYGATPEQFIAAFGASLGMPDLRQ